MSSHEEPLGQFTAEGIRYGASSKDTMRRRLIASAAVLALLGALATAAWRAVASSQDAADLVPAMVTAVGHAARDISLVPDTTLVKGRIPQRTTLDTLLRGHGVADDAAVGVVQAAARVFDPRRLRSLQPFSLERTFEGALRLFEYEVDANTFLRVTPAAPGATRWTAELVPIPRTLDHAVTAGTIDRDSPSLFQAMDAAGEGDQLAVDLAEIFSGEVDFNSELQPGDGFALAFERYTRQGRPNTYGDITAAEFRNGGRTLRAIRFVPPGGKPGYYDENGRSLRRFFLRSPLKFEPRITSRFSSSRRHPVLHTTRAHRGIDYAAPVGAPVIAAAGGVVVSVTRDGTNGRMVRLRHASGYESRYLHLSAFASGLNAGDRVGQGETIGFVGSSGLSTGPHLHYALIKNGAFVNPLVEQRNLPPEEPLPADAMPFFAAARDEALASLARVADGD
jgi:murein DD-endopeptidase MepM/ murein hydrolase activator NlpD